MPCHEFEKKGYLYLSGELSNQERDAFKRHLQGCVECREALTGFKTLWSSLEKVDSEKPGSDIRDAVLSRSRRGKRSRSFVHRLKSLTDVFLIHPRLTWGLSAAVVAVFFVMVFIRPFSMRETMLVEEMELTWQDDFMAEADWIDQELDRLESGALLASYTMTPGEDPEEDEWLSPMTQDLNWIRGKVEDLVKTIYGI